ncbi:MAG: dihydroorotate dehydrogenase electron transfer subunit [Thermoguttaceae bacterium]|jgi:dihydroorotate dehydrogenase electron transfer subunit
MNRHSSHPHQLCQIVVRVVENVPVARDTYRLRLRCAAIARRILPGQFVMLRLPHSSDPLLGRPLAMYDVIGHDRGEPDDLEIVYQVVGRMTRLLAGLEPGCELEVWGPLGNGFPPAEGQHLVLVAGGIGQTPLLALARECLGLRRYGDPPRQVPPARRVTLCYGCRTAEYLACVDDFRRAGVEVRLSTDDGSAGHHGLVTELLPPVVEASPLPCRIVACGPEKMLRATAALAARMGLACQLSLESPMACGIGICFSCVAKIRDAAGHWDYRRICVEGPVFDAADVEL